jgi:hypothetical protein
MRERAARVIVVEDGKSKYPPLNREGGVAGARFSPFLLFLLLLCLPFTAFAEYSTKEIESLRITVDTDWPGQGTSGYLPIRFDITNLAEAREIEIVVSQQHYYNPYRGGVYSGGNYDGGSTTTQQRVQLERGARVKFTMALPVFAHNENFEIQIRERGRRLSAFNLYDSFESALPVDEASVLVVSNPSTPLGVKAQTWLRTIAPGSGAFSGYRLSAARGVIVTGPIPGRGSPGSVSPTGPPLDFLLDPERLPDSWLAFTSLRAVLLGPAEWNQLNAAQKDALLTWTAAGGDLLLVDGPIETVLPQRSGAAANAGNDLIRPYYFGHIHLLKSDDITSQGLGDIILRRLNNSIDAIGRGSWSGWGLPANRARDWGWIAERGFRMPVEGVGEVPSRMYLSILGLFVVLIGPLNYLYLWRKRRQVLLVFTVPLISAVFILLLVAYGVLLEGFDVRVRAATFTVLDEGARHVATRASVSLYTGGVAPSAGVRFPSDVAVYPLGTDSYGPRGEFSLDLTGAQTFQAGLLRARTPANFEQIAFRPARERLSFERSGNELRVVNGLGATIRHLVYREGGHVYTLDGELAAGERAVLKTGAGANPAVALRTLPPGPAGRLQEVIKSQPAEGSYLAVLETSPFWEPGVDGPVESGSFHLVLGLRGNL